MGFWQITYGGITQDIAAWGVSGLKRTRKTGGTADTVTFKLDGTAFDTSPLPFAWRQPLSVTRNGVPWFSGIVTKPQPGATGKEESISYEISGTWYWLEKIQFQQQWVTCDLTGAAGATMTTTRSNTILGQSLDGVKMNSGQVMMEVLLYAQYAYQMLPFPTIVTAASLPPAPAIAAPFIIGALTPSITVPYTQFRDRSCADVIRLLLKYSPDAVAWVDYSSSPPTINIDKRSNMATVLGPGGNAKTISVLNGLQVKSFKPTPRYDLQLPVVVAKFEQKNTSNGETFDSVLVDVWPPAPPGIDPGAWASQPFAWVQTIDLIGGQSTQQTVDIKTIARPNAAADEVALPWSLSKLPWLTVGPSAGVYSDYDVPNISVAKVTTVIDLNDPLNDPNKNPNNITLPGCPQLVNELLTSAFPDWLQDDPNDLDSAKVMIEVDLKYTGTDAPTAALFWYNPANPKVPLTDGSGYFRLFYSCKVTNADTDTYSELTSWSAGEPAPVGYAKALWTALAQLHLQGTAIIVESECSDQLPVGCVFNTSDGNPDWQTMNALVLSVEEDIATGTTTVQFGPPGYLTLEDMEALFRANLGRLPSFKLSQRQTGVLTAGSNVIGNRHAADTHVVAIPGSPSTPQAFPFQIIWRTNPADPTGNTFQAKVQLNSNLLLSSNLFDTTPITGLDTWFDLDANDTIWLRGAVASLAVTPGTPTIRSFGQGHTDYDPTATAWTTGNIVENDGAVPPNQTWFRKVIGVSTPDGTGKPVIKQYVQTDLVMYNISTNGEPALYPYPL